MDGVFYLAVGRPQNVVCPPSVAGFTLNNLGREREVRLSNTARVGRVLVTETWNRASRSDAQIKTGLTGSVMLRCDAARTGVMPKGAADLRRSSETPVHREVDWPSKGHAVHVAFPSKKQKANRVISLMVS